MVAGLHALAGCDVLSCGHVDEQSTSRSLWSPWRTMRRSSALPAFPSPTSMVSRLGTPSSRSTRRTTKPRCCWSSRSCRDAPLCVCPSETPFSLPVFAHVAPTATSVSRNRVPFHVLLLTFSAAGTHSTRPQPASRRSRLAPLAQTLRRGSAPCRTRHRPPPRRSLTMETSRLR